MDYIYVFAYCVSTMTQQCDIYIVGNWHAEAVEEFEEEVGTFVVIIIIIIFLIIL